jgi:pepF/M3 family oligoendopeptidase
VTADTQELPRWDLDSIYPGIDSKDFEQSFEAHESALQTLEESFDRYAIQGGRPVAVSEATVEAIDDILPAFNHLADLSETMQGYLSCLVSADTTDESAQAKDNELEQRLVRFSMLSNRLTAWLGSMDVEEMIARSAVAADHAFALRQSKVEAEHLMEPELEELAAKLSLSGSKAMSRLHGDVSSQLEVELTIAGEHQTLPMSVVRNLAHEPDRDLRRRAYEAEIATWEAWRVPLAAALNSIKGEVNTLVEGRRWGSALDYSLFLSNIDRETLEAMMGVGRESFPDFRRYLKAKAKIIGVERCAWYDIFAPMARGARAWSYEEAQAFILENFGRFSDRMQGLARRAFDERWIDPGPRAGKVDGAFCSSIRDDESRILANYQPSYDGLSTLAHELGHAYHNLQLAGRTAIQRDTPMTLAETASNFCQTIIQKKALEAADEDGQVYILEAVLQDACQVVVDITSRFQFEQAVFDGRKERPLSPDELCHLMLTAQQDTYGDGLDPDLRHAYMWAVKPHYYSGTLSFYNYPYMFGLLFSLGLYARYQQDPDEFRSAYDDLLSATGMANAPDLAARFGIDTRDPEFWRSSLDVVREDINRFVDLV